MGDGGVFRGKARQRCDPTGRHFPPGRQVAVDWNPGRRLPSRPGLFLSGRRSGWWRDAPSSVWGG